MLGLNRKLLSQLFLHCSDWASAGLQERSYEIPTDQLVFQLVVLANPKSKKFRKNKP